MVIKTNLVIIIILLCYLNLHIYTLHNIIHMLQNSWVIAEIVQTKSTVSHFNNTAAELAGNRKRTGIVELSLVEEEQMKLIRI